MHLGTGCDYLSKIGTKYPALNANPEVFLSDFGKGLDPATDQLSKAKAYLVKLFPHSKGLKTFNQLRVNHFLKTNSMLNLPPTSLGIQDHIA